jgi:hypothetical protein
METSEVKTQAVIELEKQASAKARERAQVARWDLNIAIFLFVVLIIVIILLFQDIGVEIVAPVAVFGLAMVWLVGWRRGNQLYKNFYEEELARMKENLTVKKTMEETIEEKVQKALLGRFN